jgi:hypothetical protein
VTVGRELRCTLANRPSPFAPGASRPTRIWSTSQWDRVSGNAERNCGSWRYSRYENQEIGQRETSKTLLLGLNKGKLVDPTTVGF